MRVGRLLVILSLLLQLVPSNDVRPSVRPCTVFNGEALAARAFSERLPSGARFPSIRQAVLDSVRMWRQMALGDSRLKRFYTARSALPKIAGIYLVLGALAGLTPMNYRLLYDPPNASLLAVACALLLLLEYTKRFQRNVAIQLESESSALAEELADQAVRSVLTADFSNRSSGAAAQQLERATESIATREAAVPVRLLQTSVYFLVSLGALAVLHPPIAAFAFLAALGSAMLMEMAVRPLSKAKDSVRKLESEHDALWQELQSPAQQELMQFNGLREDSLMRLRAARAARRQARLALLTLQKRVENQQDLISSVLLMSVMTIFLAIKRYLFRDPSVGELIALVTLCWQVQFKFLSLMEILQSFQSTKGSVEEFLTAVQEKPRTPASEALQSPHIVFENVSFSYGPLVILEKLSLTLQAGKILILEGASGAGKTTLLRLITGILVPREGRILLGGFAPQEVASGIGAITQDYPLLSNLSIGENLKRARPDATHEQMERALRRAGATFIFERSEGLQASILRLSGGQRQRVSLAAALLKEPKLLVLDEPFAALDPQMRRHLVRTLRQLTREGVTLVIATHLRLKIPAQRIRLPLSSA